MAKICYETRTFRPESLKLIEIANYIISRYMAKGYSLTIRQLYYQFVTQNIFKNNERSYNQLQGLCTNARTAGLMDWDAIVDRGRGTRATRHYNHPRDIIAEGRDTFALWKWEDQPHYVEVWVEKQALEDIVASVANPLDVAYLSCKGYLSVSEMHDAALRMKHEIGKGKIAHIIHVGDHDPSGLDMTRDIKERLNNLFGVPIKVHRVALNMPQIEAYNPPPNPAKMTDTRAEDYVERYGDESWELDALEPEVLARIIKANILHWCDLPRWEKKAKREASARDTLAAIYDRWNEVYRLMKEPPQES